MQIVVDNKSILFTAILLVFAAVYLFGMPVIFGSMNHHSAMSNCPFMMEMVICPMTLFNHISMWQAIFTAVPLVFAFLALAHIFERYLPLVFYNPKSFIQNLRAPQFFDLKGNFLEFLFSQGILHSKAH